MPGCSAFSECFWDPDLMATGGFDALVRRLKEGRKLCKDLEEYYRQRSKIENQYVKDLQKLTRGMEHREDNGVLEETWNTLRTQTEWMAHHHETVTTNYHALVIDLEKLNDNVKIRSKQAEDRTTRSHNMAKTHYHKQQNLYKTYEQKCTDYTSIQNDNRHLEMADQKTAQKQKAKECKAKDEMEKADHVYHTAVDTLHNTQRIWEEDMKHACQVFQELDEERIDVLRDVIWKGTNVDSQMCVDHDMCSESIRIHLERCDIDLEISSFVERSRTGDRRPPITEYKNHFRNNASPGVARKCATGGLPIPSSALPVRRKSTAKTDGESIYDTVK